MEPKTRWRLIQPSTRALWREARRTPGYSFFDWLHGYVYARWIYLYIGIGAGEHWLARLFGPPLRILGRILPQRSDGNGQSHTIADGYHGKVVPLDAAIQLVTVQEEVNLGDLEQIIPYPVARDLVLQNPDHIAVLDCACRSVRPNHCEPVDVCLVIGEPFASFVLEHHPLRSRAISPQEAVAILTAEHERGHVHHAFFKDAMLGRFYAICNCCSCCCGAMYAHQHGTPMLASSGYVARVDEDLCVGCGSCAEACPFAAISMGGDFAHIDGIACMGCGVCVAHCPQEAITLVRDPAKGEPLEIHELMVRAAK